LNRPAHLCTSCVADMRQPVKSQSSLPPSIPNS
jgi:hypothetical protein